MARHGPPGRRFGNTRMSSIRSRSRRGGGRRLIHLCPAAPTAVSLSLTRRASSRSLPAWTVTTPESRSTRTATRMMTPVTTRSQVGPTSARKMMFWITIKVSAPSTAPRTRPRPPESAAPPMTAAAIALNSYVSPICGCTVALRPASRIPVTAARKPESTYAAMRTRSTFTPDSRAASRFDPTP